MVENTVQRVLYNFFSSQVHPENVSPSLEGLRIGGDI